MYAWEQAHVCIKIIGCKFMINYLDKIKKKLNKNSSLNKTIVYCSNSKHSMLDSGYAYPRPGPTQSINMLNTGPPDSQPNYYNNIIML